MNMNKTPLVDFKIIPKSKKLKYLICIPCVNRLERSNIHNVIHHTFHNFEHGNMFQSLISFDIILFESGSKDISYLDFINDYKSKYTNININIITSDTQLDGFTNTHRMFNHIHNNNLSNIYDFIIWMDDDIFVCKKFMENTDSWIKKYGNSSIFCSLYSPFPTFPVKNDPFANYAHIHNYYGSCCTIFKPILAKFIIPLFFHKYGKPDSKFRRSVEHFFPNQKIILVTPFSLVQHMNIGSVNHSNHFLNKSISDSILSNNTNTNTNINTNTENLNNNIDILDKTDSLETLDNIKNIKKENKKKMFPTTPTNIYKGHIAHNFIGILKDPLLHKYIR